MKIILIIPTLTSGGAERVMSILANSWIKENHEVKILVWDVGNQFYKLDNKIKVYDLGFRYKNKFERIIKQLTVAYKIRKILKAEKPTFVLSFLTVNNILVLLSAMHLNIRIIISERNSPEIIKNSLSFFLVMIRKYIYKKAYKIIMQTTIAKDFISKEFPYATVTAIPNPIKKIKRYKGIIKENIILNIGRLTEQKGQLELIEIFSKLKLTNWKLIILGEGSLRNDLETKVKDLKLQNFVELPGEVENIDEYLQKSSIFAFTSLYEGFPNALAEAMAGGLAVISYDCSTGPSELISNNENGFLIDPINREMFYIKLKELIEQPKLREIFSKNASKIKEDLSADTISTKYLKFCSNNKQNNNINNNGIT